MLHFYIGTKAQYLKMMPVMKEAEKQGLPHRMIDAGFHRGLMDHIVRDFHMRPADACLGNNQREVRTVKEAIRWFLGTGFRPLMSRRRLFEEVFGGQSGVCVLHGDAPPALVGLLHAKRCGLPVAHVESGMRSWDFFDPFPEETIRVIVMRYADLLFVPGEGALKDIRKTRTRGNIVNTRWNTIVDTAKYALQNPVDIDIPGAGGEYCVVTCHRTETLLRRERMAFVIDLLLHIAEHRQVVFVMHGPTEEALGKYGLRETLKNAANVHVLPLLEYCEFISLIHSAQFVMTDGGSIQEECAFLGKPCLLLRNRTERVDGLGENVILSKFDEAIIEDFLNNWPALTRKRRVVQISPSKIVVDELSVYNL